MTELVEAARRVDLVSAATSESPADELRRRAAELRAGTLLDVYVPGYNRGLVARMRSLEPEELRDETGELVRAAQRSADAENLAAATLICKYVREVSMVAPGDKHMAIAPDDAVPVKFDHRLLEFLGLPIEEMDTGQKVLFAILGKGRASAVTMMAQQYLNYVTGYEGEARQTLEGESPATLP